MNIETEPSVMNNCGCGCGNNNNNDCKNTEVDECTDQETEKVDENCVRKGAISRFFSNVMSVDETRISVLMICMVCTVIFGGIMYKINGTVDEHWVSVIETFAFCVTGINIAGALANGNNFLAKVINGNNPNGPSNQFRR